MTLKIKNRGDIVMFLHHLSESGYFCQVQLNDCGQEVIINVFDEEGILDEMTKKVQK